MQMNAEKEELHKEHILSCVLDEVESAGNYAMCSDLSCLTPDELKTKEAEAFVLWYQVNE